VTENPINRPILNFDRMFRCPGGGYLIQPAMNGRSTYALELLTITLPSESGRRLNYGFQAVA